MKLYLIVLIIEIFSLVSVYSLVTKPEGRLQPQLSQDELTQPYESHAARSIHFNDDSTSPPAQQPTLKLFKRGKLWTSDDDDLLLKLREEGQPWTEILKSFPERTYSGISARYYKLTRDPTAPKKRQRFWTPEEDEIIQGLVAEGKSWKEMTASLPGRSARAIKSRHDRLTGRERNTPSTVRKNYTDAEDDTIVKLVGERKSWAEMASSLDRSEKSVMHRAFKLEELGRLNLDELIPNRRRTFTAADLELMREKRAEGMKWRDIARDHFPGQTPNSLTVQYSIYRKKQEREAAKRRQEEAESEESD